MNGRAGRAGATAGLALGLLTFIGSGVRPDPPSRPPDRIEADFVSAPPSARPRVFWPWMNGNFSRVGITRDLEWMKRIRSYGVILLDGDQGTHSVVRPPVSSPSPEWYDMLRFAATEAQRLGLKITPPSSPGWSLTGGPWVKPEQAMRKFVWSETRLTGGKRFEGVLPLSVQTTGRYFDVPLSYDASVLAAVSRNSMEIASSWRFVPLPTRLPCRRRSAAAPGQSTPHC